LKREKERSKKADILDKMSCIEEKPYFLLAHRGEKSKRKVGRREREMTVARTARGGREGPRRKIKRGKGEIKGGKRESGGK